MSEWIGEWLPVLQLLLNAGALIGSAAIWKLYVDNLRAAGAVKDATIQSVEMSRDYWRDRTEELEKRSPEAMEKILTERLHIRDGEINRLKEDKEFDKIALRALEMDKARLENDLVRTQGFRAMLALEDGDEVEGDLEEPPSTIDVRYIGDVAVDSGQLLVTDPCYIDQEWMQESFEFAGEVKKTEDELFRYSYDGACRATLSGDGYGELAFTKGHAGAGVAFQTGWGDGVYPVYAEKRDGRIVRVYVNVA